MWRVSVHLCVCMRMKTLEGMWILDHHWSGSRMNVLVVCVCVCAMVVE